MKTVYFISGLGADKRAFSLLDLSFCNPVFIDWIKPLEKESLHQYALRLSQQINEHDATIVGLSFGGMLATEIAKANPDFTIIILSSNKTHNEFPYWLRIGKYIPVYKWSSENFSKKLNKVLIWILGAQSKRTKQILRDIIQDSDFAFTQWAIEAIMHWQNKIVPNNIIQIHGTADKLLPYSFVKADYTIPKGEHLMVLDKAEAITMLLKQLILK